MPVAAELVGLHPYFDDITRSTWLHAEIVERSPCAFVFSVTRPEDWDDLTMARASNQFSLLKLGKLYSIEAARELANIRFNLQMHRNSRGTVGVRDELLRQWQSRRNNKRNSWQTALYRAMSRSDWFCNGGFG